MDEIRKIPPVTRTLVGGVLAVTLPCLLQLLSPYKVIYVQALVFQKFELWRLVTSFLYGGSGLPLLFDTFMLFRGLNDLEESHFQRRTADFVWALIIIAGGVMGTNYPLRTMVFFRPFLLAVTHLWAQTNAQNRVSLFGIINLPAPYFPFALILLDLVQAGPSLAIQSATGVVAAHAYYFLAVVLLILYSDARSTHAKMGVQVCLSWVPQIFWSSNLATVPRLLAPPERPTKPVAAGAFDLREATGWARHLDPEGMEFKPRAPLRSRELGRVRQKGSGIVGEAATG
ncbi:BQ5605_C016g08289 [Microbotryum silenes-dioicae]|uniref:Derlin n=1 Tax=Microbotryum silenes-dioicae TaxID=796604 RepID=A0A2X0MQL8_9BASI|nr:BQ5605_C016g08289 [Microbotryum silenes-dioicae]